MLKVKEGKLKKQKGEVEIEIYDIEGDKIKEVGLRSGIRSILDLLKEEIEGESLRKYMYSLLYQKLKRLEGLNAKEVEEESVESYINWLEEVKEEVERKSREEGEKELISYYKSMRKYYPIYELLKEGYEVELALLEDKSEEEIREVCKKYKEKEVLRKIYKEYKRKKREKGERIESRDKTLLYGILNIGVEEDLGEKEIKSYVRIIEELSILPYNYSIYNYRREEKRRTREQLVFILEILYELVKEKGSEVEKELRRLEEEGIVLTPSIIIELYLLKEGSNLLGEGINVRYLKSRVSMQMRRLEKEKRRLEMYKAVCEKIGIEVVEELKEEDIEKILKEEKINLKMLLENIIQGGVRYHKKRGEVYYKDTKDNRKKRVIAVE